jgi:hypothetical protein
LIIGSPTATQINKTITKPAQIPLPLKHTIYYPKMNDTTDMDSTIAGPINVRS